MTEPYTPTTETLDAIAAPTDAESLGAPYNADVFELRRRINTLLALLATVTPDPDDERQVETVARALCIAAGGDPDHVPSPGSPPSEAPDPQWTDYVDDARAALTALAALAGERS